MAESNFLLENKMRTKDKKWKEFKLTEVFPIIQRGKRFKKSDHRPGNIPYVSSSGINNGIDGFIADDPRARKFSDCLTIAYNGSVGSTFYHPYMFVASDDVISLKNILFSKSVYIFLANQILRLKNKYGYSRKINYKRLLKEKVLLPVNENNEPDYEWMQNYIKEKEQEKKGKIDYYFSARIEKLKNIKETEAIKNKEWAAFSIENIFPIIQRGKQFKKAEQELGNLPFVSASEKNNGISLYVSDNKNLQKFENCLGINNDGSVGWCFYHPYEFAASSVVTALKNEEFSKYTYLFLAAQISKLRNKFNYGYKLNSKRLKKQKIMLPINENKEPDYEWMENYIREKEQEKKNKINCYFSARIEKLKDIKETETIEDKEWAAFSIEEIFPIIKRGKQLQENDSKQGNIPYVSASEKNNGISGFIKEEDTDKNFANCLTIASTGSVGSTFYHPYFFVASNNVTVLKNSEFSKYVYLFLVIQISKFKDKFSYGYTINLQRLKKQKIILPVNENRGPDYEWMENYMRRQGDKLLAKYKHVRL